MKEIQNVTIVGAGTMGHSLAQVFAQSGYKVWLNDLQEEILSKAKGRIAANLQTLVELRFLEQKDAAVPSRILTTPRIEEAGRDADFVIEAVIEDKYAKKEIFKTLDRVCPDRAILASNTSYLDIFKFVETRRPDKVLITHWFAPPHIVPLVEIVHGSDLIGNHPGDQSSNDQGGENADCHFKISSRVYCQSSAERPNPRSSFSS